MPEKQPRIAKKAELGLYMGLSIASLGLVENSAQKQFPEEPKNIQVSREIHGIPSEFALTELLNQDPKTKNSDISPSTDLSRFADKLDTESKILITGFILTYLLTQYGVMKKTMENALEDQKQPGWAGLAGQTSVGLYIISRIWS